jgi:hypothetical protein
MELLKRIYEIQTSDEFVNLIEANSEKISDYFSIVNYSELLKSKAEFHRLAVKVNLLNEINVKTSKISSFILLVLKTSIRLGDRLVFQRYYDVLINQNVEKSLLIQSSSLFMLNVRTFDDFKNRFDELLTKLEEAYLLESDSNKDAISALVNYFSIIVSSFFEFASDAVIEIREMIKKEFELKRHSFLDDEIVNQICSIDLFNISKPIDEIQRGLDGFLSRKQTLNFNSSRFLIEKDTPYSTNFGRQKTLSEIIALNKSIYEPMKSDRVYYSLDRGIKILEEEQQLFAYVYSFGKMHEAKLNTSISAIPSVSNAHTLVDWGCGQGLGSLMYFEKKGVCNQCVLIEPSEIALKRAALHIKDWSPNIITVNKGFDDLNSQDFELVKKNSVFIHLMSNVLDMELFSLTTLIKNIEENFNGINYFLISSPYIDVTRTQRLDTFMSHFENSSSFKLFERITEKKGEWSGTNWSRTIRVFKTELK